MNKSKRKESNPREKNLPGLEPKGTMAGIRKGFWLIINDKLTLN